MNAKKFMGALSEVNDRYVSEALSYKSAEQSQLHRKGGKIMLRKIAAVAAVAALMVCSCVVGALAFSRETVVEVPAEQETVSFEEIGLTLILPDSWKGQYAAEKTGGSYCVYSPAVREAFSAESGIEDAGGMLFYIMKWDRQLTAQQAEDIGGEWNFAGNRYIMTTKDGTYFLYYASDVQFTQDTMELYRQMESGIKDIRFVVDDAFGDS